MKVKVLITYYDLVLKRTVNAGEILEVNKDRAKYLKGVKVDNIPLVESMRSKKNEI